MKTVTYVGLLRGINVGSSTRVPMDRLRNLCEDLGWRDVRTYIQSGNIIFRSRLSDPPLLEEQLEVAMPGAFGISPAVLVRDSASWKELAAGNPFTDEAAATPNLVMLAISKQPPRASALDILRERAGTEQVERVGDAFWLHYPDGAGRSGITPAILDRAVGSPVTTRNVTSVRRIANLAEE